MRPKFTLNAALFLTAFLVFFPSAKAQMDAELSMNVKDSPLKGVLEMIAAKSGLQLVLGQDPNVNVTLVQSGATARQLLDKLAQDQQIEYTISGNQLIVTRRGLSGNIGDSHLIHLNYASAQEVSGKMRSVVSNEEKILVDERENNLIFMGSKGNFEKVKALATLFDSTPKQIQIEALIVETSHAFMRQLGISMAGFGDTIQTPGPNQPNGTFKTVLDNLNSKSLELKLTAAESNGNAKVVSRPKVITLNNKTAKVQSGITYHVKTLSNVQAGETSQSSASGQSSTTPGVVTGGVASVEAGLSLNILPTMVGTDDIKLTVDINNSTSDIGSSVDGIPGIIKNSANTTVIVRNKQTAVIAGLIKQQTSKNSGGVPFLSDIPLLGLLFKSHASTDENNELVIFLTPTIGNPETGNPDAYVEEGRFRSHSGPATAPEAPPGN